MAQNVEYICGDEPIEINVGRRRATVRVANTGDRPIQVGSHYHFFEANRALEFDREVAYGMRLDIPSGTAVRFEPGDTREVPLCAYGGNGRMVGFSNLVNGGIAAADTRLGALRRAAEHNFKDVKRTADSGSDREGESR